MAFAHPIFLWLLVLAPALAYAGWCVGGPRRWATALLRAICVATMALALAQPMLAWPSETKTVVRVIDLSPAVSDADIDAAVRSLPLIDDSAPVVVFSNRAEVLADRTDLSDPIRRAALRQRLAAALWSDDPENGGPNLTAALQLAAAQVPLRTSGEVQLHATGLSNHGDAAAEAWRLAGRGIAVRPMVIAAVTTALPPVRVKRITIAGRARLGQTLRATIEIESSVSGHASFRLTPGNGTPVTETIDVSPGLNHTTVAVPLATPGLIQIRASTWINDGPAKAGDTVNAAVQVRPAANVLLVQDRVEPGLANSLNAVLGSSVRLIAATPDSLTEQTLATADSVILADIPADHLPAAAQTVLREAVRNGTGLLVAGAARSFGPGGYDDSQLASILPVKMPQQSESIDPSTTLVLIIDSSGSMMGDRMDLAKEIARLAMSHLKPHDKVGIVEFYGGKRWAAPIQSAANVSIIGRALDRLTAGGGTTLFPAVEEAAFALRNVRTRGKNLLILSDGMVEEAPFASLIGQMAEDGITVSTAQVGPPDSGGFANLMPDLARWGNGHYYTVPDPYALPDITFKQPQISIIAPVVRTPTHIVAGEDELMRGTTADALGLVHGYVRTESKPTADVLLKTTSGDPLMVRWRYGAGFVSALTTQLGSAMTADLQSRPAFARALSGLMRQLNEGRGDPLAVTATVRPAGVEVDIVATHPDAALSARPLEITLANATGTAVRHLEVEPIAPAHWNVLLPGVTAGAYAITAKMAGDAASGEVGFAIAPPLAIPSREADRPLLEQIESFSTLAAEQAALLPPQQPVWIALQKSLALLAVLFLVALVAVRRWPVAVNR